MKTILFFLFLAIAPAACGPLCDAGLCSVEHKKGDLDLTNNTDWKVVKSAGIKGDPELVEYDNFQIPPDMGATFYDVIIPDDGDLTFMLTYVPASDMPSGGAMDVYYNVDMVPDTLTDVVLNGKKMYGDWLTPSDDNMTVTYPNLPSTPGGGGDPGGGDTCAGASTGPCNGYTKGCLACGSTGCQAPCYCAAACVCKYCGDSSCEAENRKTAASLGTTCSY